MGNSNLLCSLQHFIGTASGGWTYWLDSSYRNNSYQLVDSCLQRNTNPFHLVQLCFNCGRLYIHADSCVYITHAHEIVETRYKTTQTRVAQLFNCNLFNLFQVRIDGRCECIMVVWVCIFEKYVVRYNISTLNNKEFNLKTFSNTIIEKMWECGTWHVITKTIINGSK